MKIPRECFHSPGLFSVIFINRYAAKPYLMTLAANRRA